MGSRGRATSHAAIIVLSAVLLGSGCAAVRGPQPMTPEQAGALKARLGKIGVVGARFMPAVEVQTPAKGAAQGAAGGMVSGAAAPFELAKGDTSGYGLLFAIALAPVGAVIGGVGGAITADSAEKVNERETRIKQVLAELHMQEMVRDRLAARLNELKTFEATTMNDAGPTRDGELQDYRESRSAGIGTVNEIVVRKLALTGSGKVNPDLAVRLTAHARLVSTSDNAELLSRDYVCASKPDKFEAWAAQNGQRFRDEIERCYDDIAAQAVKEAYVNTTLMR